MCLILVSFSIARYMKGTFKIERRKLFPSLLSYAQIDLEESVDDFYFPLGNIVSFSNWLDQSLLEHSPAMPSQFSPACSLSQLFCTFQFNEIIFPWCFAGFSCPFLFFSRVIMLTNILSKKAKTSVQLKYCMLWTFFCLLFVPAFKLLIGKIQKKTPP